MPTIFDNLRRKRGYPSYYQVAERMAIRKVSCFLMMFGLLDMLKQSAKNAVRTIRRANVILSLMATLASAMLQEEIEIWSSSSNKLSQLFATSSLATLVRRKVESKIPMSNVACDGFAYGFENFGSCLILCNMFFWGLQRSYSILQACQRPNKSLSGRANQRRW